MFFLHKIFSEIVNTVEKHILRIMPEHGRKENQFKMTVQIMSYLEDNQKWSEIWMRPNHSCFSVKNSNWECLSVCKACYSNNFQPIYSNATNRCTCMVYLPESGKRETLRRRCKKLDQYLPACFTDVLYFKNFCFP